MPPSPSRQEKPEPKKNQKFVSEDGEGEIVFNTEPMNNPSCPHLNMVRDETETEFNAFMCDAPNCGLVKIYDKL